MDFRGRIYVRINTAINPTLDGTSLAPSSEVRTATMLVLLIIGN